MEKQPTLRPLERGAISRKATVQIPREQPLLGHCLVARETEAGFEAGEWVATYAGPVSAQPSRFSVQVSPTEHITDEGLAKFANHSCRPTCRLVLAPRAFPLAVLLARRRIRPGEALTFHYGASEWHMDEPFACLCAALDAPPAASDAGASLHDEAECLGRVAGLQHLPLSKQMALRPLMPAYLRRHVDWRVAAGHGLDADSVALHIVPPAHADDAPTADQLEEEQLFYQTLERYPELIPNHDEENPEAEALRQTR